jgi:hypothetical protein
LQRLGTEVDHSPKFCAGAKKIAGRISVLLYGVDRKELFCIYLHLFSCHTSGMPSIKAKVKQSLYRPGKALRATGGSSSQIPRQSAHEVGKFVSPTHRPPLPPGNIPGIHFC